MKNLCIKRIKLKQKYQTLQDGIYKDDLEEISQNIPHEKISQQSFLTSETEVSPPTPLQNVNIKRNVRCVKNG